MMTLHQLRIFWAVAHSESLTKASKQLGLAQPSLSQQLAKLEETVGTKLFTRTRNQMELTDAGKFLVRKAEMILGGVDEAMAGLRQLSDGKGGVITMAGSTPSPGSSCPAGRIFLRRVHGAPILRIGLIE